MAFEINGSAPPAGGRPVGKGTVFKLPQSAGLNGLGEPVAAIGKPSLELHWNNMNETAWTWWAALTGEDPSVELTSIQVWNPYKSGGPDWETYNGDDDHAAGILHRPVYSEEAYGAFWGVSIRITSLTP